MKTMIAGYVMLFTAFFLLIGSVNLPRLWSITNSPAETYATVTKTTPDDHDTFYYSFRVGSSDYQGNGHIHRRDLRPGYKVRITYSIANPGYSTEGKPEPQFYNELFIVVMAANLGALVAFAGIKRGITRRNQDRQLAKP